MISMSEIKMQSESVQEKVTNVSAELALAQEESIANQGENDQFEIIAAAQEQAKKQAIVQENRKKEEARIAQVKTQEDARRLAEVKAKELARDERAKLEAQLAAKEEVAEAEKVTSAAADDDSLDEKENSVFRNIIFDFDKSDLRLLSQKELDKIYAYLDKNPKYVLQLDGHADWIGTVEYNLSLSERRAKQAYKYLRVKGISDERIVYQFYGEALPVAPNANADGTDNPEGRQLNRRCEFDLKEEGTADIILKF